MKTKVKPQQSMWRIRVVGAPLNRKQTVASFVVMGANKHDAQANLLLNQPETFPHGGEIEQIEEVSLVHIFTFQRDAAPRDKAKKEV